MQQDRVGTGLDQPGCSVPVRPAAQEWESGAEMCGLVLLCPVQPWSPLAMERGCSGLDLLPGERGWQMLD